jgi:hypothetical protein
VPEPSISKDEVAIGKSKMCKSPGADEIPSKNIQAGGEKLQPQIHSLIELSGTKENVL